MYRDLVLSDEEYFVLEDAMRTASMGAVLVAEAGHSANTVMATSKEVSAFLALLERNLRFVYEGVSKRHDEALDQARAVEGRASWAAAAVRAAEEATDTAPKLDKKRGGKERKAIARMEAMIDEAIRGGIYPPHLRGHLIGHASFGESFLADVIGEAAAAKKEFEKGAKADYQRVR